MDDCWPLWTLYKCQGIHPDNNRQLTHLDPSNQASLFRVQKASIVSQGLSHRTVYAGNFGIFVWLLSTTVALLVSLESSGHHTLQGGFLSCLEMQPYSPNATTVGTSPVVGLSYY